MAQPLIKFFRIAKITDLQAVQKVQGGLYFETSTGILYVYNGTAFESYSGLKSASFADQKLVLTPSVGSAIEIDLSGYVDSTEIANYVLKEQTIAGIDLKDNITAEELKAALGLNSENLAGQANVLEGVKVNGDDLTVAADKTVDILIAEGATNGTIAVNGTDIAVHGLGSAAYTASTAYDAAGTAAGVQTALVNGETEFANFKAVGDELRALDLAAADKVADVKVGETSVVNSERVAVLGTAAGKAIEDFDAAGAAAGALVDAKKYTDEAKAAIIGDATTAGDTLGKLEGLIGDIAADAKTYSVVKMTADEVAALGNSNVREAYKLVDEDTEAVGDPILIYKDSSLKSAAMGTGGDAQKLMLTYILADGKESVVPVDLSAFYAESETGDGLQVVDHVISVKRDEASEAFLSVGAAGVKLSGVQDAINTAKNEAIAAITTAIQDLDATVGSQTVAEGKHIAVEVVESDGVLTGLTVVESDIASAQALATLNTEVQEHEEVVAAALVDLNERMTTAEGEIDALQTAVEGINVGVTKVTGDTTNTFVKVSATPETGDVALGVQVAVQDGATAGTKLATDTYVAEQSAAAQAAAVATAASDATSKANTAESNAKAYADNLMSWSAF